MCEGSTVVDEGATVDKGLVTGVKLREDAPSGLSYSLGYMDFL